MIQKQIERVLLLILILILLQLSIRYLTRMLITEDLIYEELIKRFDGHQIIDFLKKRNQEMNYWGYILSISTLLIKISLVYFCIVVGMIAFNASFSNQEIFKAVIISEFVFFLPQILKLFWFGLIKTDYSLPELLSFGEFSLLGVLGETIVQPWLAYPFRLINVFEFLYWLALAFQLKDTSGRSFQSMFGFVALTYGTGLFLWTIIVVFISVSLN